MNKLIDKMKGFLLVNLGLQKIASKLASSSDFKLVLNTQRMGGMALFFSAIIAVLFVNSSYCHIYQQSLDVVFSLDLPSFEIHKEMNLKMLIDDCLMAVFFLLVGLELKREILIGQLSTRAKVVLPVFAALGGVILPIVIFSLINIQNPENFAGAAIPAATDIAFVIAILSLFGDKISNSLRIFLIAVAIIDDLIAILIIAIFYSHSLDFTYLSYSIFLILLLFIFNIIEIKTAAPYLMVAPFLWLFIFKSGIHPTIAGIALAAFIPFNKEDPNQSAARFLEHILHIPVNYFILPLFAFVNSGIVLDHFSIKIFSDRLVLGIVLGLFVGKQLGIGLIVYFLDRCKICSLFSTVKFLEFYGVAVLAGIGFTMSLFIGNLAFVDADLVNKVKIGVIAGSILSAIFGSIILSIATWKK